MPLTPAEKMRYREKIKQVQDCLVNKRAKMTKAHLQHHKDANRMAVRKHIDSKRMQSRAFKEDREY